MKIRGAYGNRLDYSFYYKDKQVDSFVVIDSSKINPAPVKMTSKAIYNTQSLITGIVTSESGKDLYTTSYNRNANGKIDSIRAVFSYDNAFGYRTIHPSADVSPVNTVVSPIDPAYKLLLAVRQDQYLITLGSNNLFFHSFLNAGDNLFNNGIYTKANALDGLQYKCVSSVNANNIIKAYQYSEAYSGQPIDEKFGIRFEYFTGK